MAYTQEQRDSNSKFVNQYMSAIIGAVSAYAFGYAQAISTETGCGIFEAITKIPAFVLSNLPGSIFFNPLKGFLGIAFGIILGVVMYFFLSVDYENNKHYDLSTVAGDAQWMSQEKLKEYNEKYIKPEPENDSDPSPNIIMSKNMKRPVVASTLIGNNNVLVVGGAGTGKSRGIIKPNILQFNASYVCTDPSGEIIYDVGDALTNNGYKIKIFNLCDKKHSNMYNPLHYIRDNAGVAMVVNTLISNTREKGEKGDAFFENAEKLLYTAIIYYLKDHEPDKSKLNFPTVINMVNMSSVDETNAANYKSDLDKLFDKLPRNSLASKFYTCFKQAAGRTLKSIIISCVVRLQSFLIPEIIDLTRDDEMELEKIGDEKTAVFIITPQADNTYNFLVSMLYAQLFETLYYMGEERQKVGGSPESKYHVRCLMDEFANIGEVPLFPSKLSTMRKYNISATVILQNISQIEAMYKDDWKNLVGNCSSIVFLGSSEYYTLKYFSDILGDETVINKNRNVSRGRNSSASAGFQRTSKKLMSTNGLNEMPPDECIVITQNLKPLWDKKFKYEDHPRYHLTAKGKDGKPFNYSEMAAFTTSSDELLDISSLVRAQNSMSVIKNTIAQEPEKADAFFKNCKSVTIESAAAAKKAKTGTRNIYEETVLDIEKQKKNESLAILNGKKTVEKQIFFSTIKNAVASNLESLAFYVSKMTSVKRFVIFLEITGKQNLIGIGYNGCDEEDFASPEISPLHTEYTKKFVGSIKERCYLVSFEIKATDKSNFIKAVENNYKKTAAERARERLEQSVDESRKYMQLDIEEDED